MSCSRGSPWSFFPSVRPARGGGRNAFALSGPKRTMHARLLPFTLPDRHSRVHNRRASAGRGRERRRCGSESDCSCKKKEAKLPCVTLWLTDRCFLPDLAGLSKVALRRTWPSSQAFQDTGPRPPAQYGHGGNRCLCLYTACRANPPPADRGSARIDVCSCGLST